MKITFLGTAAGVPSPGRKFSSVAIETDEGNYLIDAGGGVLYSMVDRGIEVNSLRSVFITHTHLDHIGGIIDLVDLISWSKRFSLASVDYFFPDEFAIELVKSFVTKLSTPVCDERNRFHAYGEHFSYDDGNIKLTTMKNGHMRAPERASYSFLLEKDGKRILFTGDLSQGLAKGDFPKVVKEEYIDILVCELAHFDLATVLSALEGAKVGTVYFTHVRLPEERIPEIEAAASSGKYPFAIFAAVDGDTVVI